MLMNFNDISYKKYHFREKCRNSDTTECRHFGRKTNFLNAAEENSTLYESINRSLYIRLNFNMTNNAPLNNLVESLNHTEKIL